MKTEWTKVHLNEIATVIMGQSPKSEYYNNRGNGYPFLQGNRTFGEKYPSYDTYTTSLTKLGKSGSVIMSVRAPVGELNMIQEDICLGRGVCAIRMQNDEQEFLYYLLKANMELLLRKQSGTIFGSVNHNDIEELEVYVPASQKKQHLIGKYLKNIDDKIIINALINHNLEEQAKAMFWRNFPYSVDDKLPSGWQIGSLDDILVFHDSKRIPLSSTERDKRAKIYPYYGAASQMDFVDDYLFDGVYLLLGEDGTVVTDTGFPILQYVWGKIWVNNHAHILTGKSGFRVETLWLLLSNTPVKSIVTGAVQPKISQANLKGIPVAIPPEETIKMFGNSIAPLFEQIRNNTDENKKLAELRDTLLPKLMSGEIDVSEVEV